MKCVVFCIDRSYTQHFFVSLASFLAHHDYVDIYVLHNGVSQEEIECIKSFVAENAVESSIEFCLVEENLELAPTGDHFTSVSYFRLFIHRYLRNSKARVLYVDADTVFSESINEVFDVDLRGNVIAAVEDPVYQEINLATKHQSAFFNSGLMLVDLQLWVDKDISRRVLNYVVQYPDNIKFVDQCGLNAIIGDSWKALHPRFNMQSSFFNKHTKLMTYNEQELRNAKVNPAMIHYTGESKPWKFLDYHPYRFLYYKYLKVTPYKKYRSDDYSIKNILTKNYDRTFRAFLRRKGLK